MSASPLNLAAMTGAGPQPGAAQGIAQQGAQAQQASGPLAGFEALLAAFFGDQGVGVPQPTATVPGKAAGKGDKAPADPAAPAASDDASAAVDKTVTDPNAALLEAALALGAPGLAAPPTTPAAGNGGDDLAAGDGAGEAATPKVPPGLAVAAAATDAKAAKVAALLAPDTAASVAAPTDGKPDETPKTPPASAPQPPPGLAHAAEVNNGQGQPFTAAPDALPPGLAGRLAAAAPAISQAAPPEKPEPPKTPRVEGAPTQTAPLGAPAKPADLLLAASADGSGKDASSDQHDPAPGLAPPDPKAPHAEPAPSANDFAAQANAAAQVNNPAALAHAAAAVRGSPQTVANLAAQIAKKLDARSTRFDVQLEPAGLGKVDVRVEIDAAGKMSAAMNFDSQQSANELKSRAGELQRALEQAGFDLSGGLSFDVAGQGAQGQAFAQDPEAQTGFRGRAFQAVLNGAAEADAAAAPSLYLRNAASSGVDIRI